MSLHKKRVNVELRTVIDDEGRKELSIIKQQGTYMANERVEVITFKEETEDFGPIKNIITIYPNKVTIKRTGLIRMVQQFVVGEKYECLYRHPYGSFLMEIDTKSIEHKQLRRTDGIGTVCIEYDARMDRNTTRYHHLTLTYTEEK
ncbi:MAG TPA: DUF1934 domain-containing protein [Pseudogracilibacillus sp.]|nr:DUF1934 domain-containing protein [Pseudogracilibacillus sp.]